MFSSKSCEWCLFLYVHDISLILFIHGIVMLRFDFIINNRLAAAVYKGMLGGRLDFCRIRNIGLLKFLYDFFYFDEQFFLSGNFPLVDRCPPFWCSFFFSFFHVNKTGSLRNLIIFSFHHQTTKDFPWYTFRNFYDTDYSWNIVRRSWRMQMLVFTCPNYLVYGLIHYSKDFFIYYFTLEFLFGLLWAYYLLSLVSF